MQTRTACVVLAVLAGAAPLAAQQRTTQRITEADLMARVAILADDSMLGREAGHIGNVKATDYIAGELRRLGLEPAGDRGTFFQTIPLMRRGFDTTGVLLAPGGVVLAHGRDFVPLRPVGGNPFGGSFRADGVPVVFGGRIGTAQMLTPDSARGRLVVFLPAIGGNGAPAPTLVGGGGALARYADAAGVAIAGYEGVPAPVRGFLAQPRFVLVDSTVPAPRALAAIAITTEAAERLLGASLTAAQPGQGASRVRGAFGFSDRPTAAPARNVVGILRGRDRALRATYLAVGAHTDHDGIGAVLEHDSVRAFNTVMRPLGANDPIRQPDAAQAARIAALRDSLRALRAPRPDSILNGADDDASGTAVALELAEYFARNRPRRSLLFVFHTAEEKGLFGAAYYTDHPTVPRDSIIAQINMDQVSRGGPDDVPGSQSNSVYLLGTRRLSRELGDLVETINAGGHQLRFDYSLDADGHPLNGYCRSDHYMYARYGIPVVFLSAGWHRDYHMVTDETAYVNGGTMFRIASFVQDLTAAVADRDARPLVDRPRPDPRAPCRQ